MRVLHLTRDYPPRANGGLSVAVPALVGAASRFADAHVASFDAWRPKGKPVERLPDGDHITRLTGPDDLPRLRARALAFDPDLVHVHDALLYEVATELGRPTVYHAHVLQAHLRTLRGLSEPTKSERAEARALADARWIIAPSGAAADRLPGRVSVVPFPVEVPAARDEGDGSALFVGRFADVKGIAELFHAIRIVSARMPEARFVIAGGLPDNARAERRWLKRFEQCAGRDAIEATTFEGWCNRSRLAELYARASVLVVPSWTETFGLALAEGMAHGLAVIATDLPAFRERLMHRREGLLVTPRDAQALAGGVLRLLRSPEKRTRLGEGARAASLRRSGDIAGALRRVYESALGPAHAASA